MSRSRRRSRRRGQPWYRSRRAQVLGAGAAGVIALAAAVPMGAFSELFPSGPQPIEVGGGQPVSPEVGRLTEVVHIGMVDTSLSDGDQRPLLARRLTQLAVLAAHDEAQLYLSAGGSDPAAEAPIVAAGDFRTDGVEATNLTAHLARSVREFTKSATAAIASRPASPVTNPVAELRTLAAQGSRAQRDGAKRVILTLIGSAIATDDHCNFTVAFQVLTPQVQAQRCLAAAARTGQPLDLRGATVRLAGVGVNDDGPQGLAEYTTATMLEIVRRAHGHARVIDLDGGPIGAGT